VDIAAYAQAYHAFAHGDATYAARWPEVRCPVLALTADGDPNSTPAMSRAIAAAAPDAQALVIEGHRHMVSLTDPVGVNAALTDWLDRAAPAYKDRAS
jgi:pimeloyl-ACP methyl ester carboxylesterase